MKLERVIISQEEIQARVAQLGAEISRDYEGKELFVICILKGAFIFMADLIRHIDVPLEVDFMSLSSYGKSTQTSGAVRMIRDLDQEVNGKDVLVVEDIIDTGLTLSYLKENLKARKPNSLKFCTFLDKPSRRKVEFAPDYSGVEIEDYFVVGYGLDYQEKGRELPFIGVVESTE